jgi:23S rRNA maturation-related 3'-5' exoribonuclease YhaM
MLAEENILANYERFMKGSKKYGFSNDKLFEILGKEFIEAPASTLSDRHNAFKGGLIDHILRVTEIALRLNKQLPDALK